MKSRIHLKRDKAVIDIEQLTVVNVCSDKVTEFPIENVSQLPLSDDLSYVFVGNKTVAISGAEILYVDFV